MGDTIGRVCGAGVKDSRKGLTEVKKKTKKENKIKKERRMTTRWQN